MEQPDWVSEAIDVDRPSVARMYDYALGGLHNFAVDREAAREMFAVIPDLPLLIQANRAFLRRVVQFLVGAGIRQFLDIGSGIPTVGNVHEIARQFAPETRVVYVDIDPIAVAHSRAILTGDALATVIQEDLHHPDHIIAHPDVRGLLDFSQPIGLLLIAVMQFIREAANPPEIVARLRDCLAPGSYVAISQPTNDSRTEEAAAAEGVIAQLPTPFRYANRTSFGQLFDGWQLVDPGVVWVSQWHPDSPDGMDEFPERSMLYVGVGCKA